MLRSRGNVDLLKLRMNPMRSEVVVKDPFLSLCGQRLSVLAPSSKVVYVVRHPVAVYESIMRMNWDLKLPLSLSALDSLPLPERVAALWNKIYSSAESHIQREPGLAIMVRHEDICLRPLQTFSEICDASGLKLTAKMRRAISTRMFGTTVLPDAQTLHVRNRDSQRLAFSWRDRKSPAHPRIIENSGELLRRQYPECFC